eukprot:163952-Ditylum_brightwellii.AAC.1
MVHILAYNNSMSKPVMVELSSLQWQQALFAVSLANGAPMPSTAAAIATAHSPSFAPTPSPTAAVSALVCRSSLWTQPSSS